jgi:hypothetical protein
MFGSYERHRKWPLKNGSAAADVIEVRGPVTETSLGRQATIWQMQLWAAAVGEPFAADVTDEWCVRSPNFPQMA